MIASHRFPMYEPDENHVVLDYLLYFFKSKRGKHLLELASPGGAGRNKTLSKSGFTTISVPLPNTDEQKKVAETIATWDHAITLTEELLAEKELRRKGLMQQLLTGKKRLPGFDGAWMDVPLNEIFKSVRRKNSMGETLVLTASGKHGLVDQTQYFNRNVAGKDLSGYYLLNKGEFAYNRSSMNGYPFGAIKRLDEHDTGILSTLYICFAASSSECCSDFYLHVFEAGIINYQLRGIVQVGARAHGLLNVSVNDFFNVKVSCPSAEEQKQIAKIFNAVDLEIDLIKNKLTALREHKRGLMQQLLTGKIRTKATASNKSTGG